MKSVAVIVLSVVCQIALVNSASIAIATAAAEEESSHHHKHHHKKHPHGQPVALAVVSGAAPAPAGAPAGGPAGPASAPASVEAEPAEPPKTVSTADPSVEIDTQLPYGELEAFGREDTAQELTESSVKSSNTMIDQLERAEVAEEKRSVFRALTRLRGATITSYDGIARSQTGNINDYAKKNQWRKAHPIKTLAEEESDVSKWAFASNADFL
eukprot:TRINITY_DN3068_c0_g3_i1.p1 TRINITY_DN3068_c0_g3~~TRINITY_DN3068_c0_g3_i1.p1  ORF type:complete len:213 (-),score=60.62 TRINITY_DN3068_c0_g3_i1:94-732(-)